MHPKFFPTIIPSISLCFNKYYWNFQYIWVGISIVRTRFFPLFPVFHCIFSPFLREGPVMGDGGWGVGDGESEDRWRTKLSIHSKQLVGRSTQLVFSFTYFCQYSPSKLWQLGKTSSKLIWSTCLNAQQLPHNIILYIFSHNHAANGELWFYFRKSADFPQFGCTDIGLWYP